MDYPKHLVKHRPSYWVGLLCLIPLIGFIAGVFILLTGIFRYRDKVFIAIGIFGIVFTTGIYSYLFYQMRFGDAGLTGFTAISQMQLNNLVQKIEFYNLQNGRYPHSLEELLETDQLSPIADPLQLSQGQDKINYNYQKLERGYTLFSSGLDGKPGTADDFYPDIKIDSASKLGLIKNFTDIEH